LSKEEGGKKSGYQYDIRRRTPYLKKYSQRNEKKRNPGGLKMPGRQEEKGPFRRAPLDLNDLYPAVEATRKRGVKKK